MDVKYEVEVFPNKLEIKLSKLKNNISFISSKLRITYIIDTLLMEDGLLPIESQVSWNKIEQIQK